MNGFYRIEGEPARKRRTPTDKVNDGIGPYVIERRRANGHTTYALKDGSGALVVVALYLAGAAEVARRLRALSPGATS